MELYSAVTPVVKQKSMTGGGERDLGAAHRKHLDIEAFQRLLCGYEKARNEGFAPVNPAIEELLSANKAETVFMDQSIHVPGLSDSQGDSHAQEIIPEAFYFVKLFESEGHKTFINMCGCSEIAAPGEWQKGVPLELEESIALMESDAAIGTQNLRFSLSCSDHIFLTDNQGKLCKVYDVVFNRTVMRHSMVHKELRNFLINMAITWINQKYGVELKPG
ncbi:hypothetical protein L7F22_041469 [Adiantum nelumboides]|nr:hypothetical protein [Adiantum nelumboides]